MYHRVAVVASGKNKLNDVSVLDLACGRGGGLAFLADYFDLRDAVGIDSCSRQVSFAVDSFKGSKFADVSFLVGDIETISINPLLQERKFKMILCIEAWHTLPNTLEALRQASNLIEEDGQLLISDGFLID